MNNKQETCQILPEIVCRLDFGYSDVITEKEESQVKTFTNTLLKRCDYFNIEVIEQARDNFGTCEVTKGKGEVCTVLITLFGTPKKTNIQEIEVRASKILDKSIYKNYSNLKLEVRSNGSNSLSFTCKFEKHYLSFLPRDLRSSLYKAINLKV